MPAKKTENKSPGIKDKAVPFKGIGLSPPAAKLGFIYAEVLGRPVSKRRRLR